MALSITTNLASLNAQRQLQATNGQLSSAMARLASGLRVNSAKDDPAGLAIAERMSVQARGMNVALRNTNDGISLAQTAEGGLARVGDALQRMRELAVQSRNATNAFSDRESLQKEFAELQKEIARVLGGTSFNGRAILGADATTLSFQVGANTGVHDTVEMAMSDLSADTRLQAVTAGVPSSADLAAANAAVGPAVLAALTSLGYAPEGVAVSSGYGGASSAVGAAIEAVSLHAVDQGFGSQVSTVLGALANATTGDEAYAAVLAGATAVGWGDPTAPATTAKAAFEAFAAVVPVSNGLAIGGGSDTDAIKQAIDGIDTALDFVNDQRATFGAAQSRFESVIGVLQSSIEQQTAARSRIMDADYAQETAHLSRAQILQQAGNAMVVQANQTPQSVLQLLR